jgi:DNA repair protein SbcC/Rad50
MKPLSLEFTSFGSYPGKEYVDFESLTGHGLYVVTGPTGSGKTTIFDAMAYALYGEVPGARDKGDVRSQHAHADATCSVVLRFDIDGEVYRVERTPEQYKPRQRGEGTPVKVTAKASLVRESDDESLESGSTKVSKYCIDLVGLDATQFERVVLLPQGQFQQFLLADTAERLPLLQKLFGTEKWEGVVNELKTQANDAKSIVGETNAQLDQRTFAIEGSLDAAEALLPDAEEIGSEIEADLASETTLESLHFRFDALAERAAPLTAHAQELAKSSASASAAFAKAKEMVANWDRRLQLQNERESLDQQVSAIDLQRSRRDHALAAAPVIAAFANEQRDAAERTRASSETDVARAALAAASEDAGLGALIDPDVAAAARVSALAENEMKRESVRQLEEATGSLGVLGDQIDTLRTDQQQLEQRSVAIEEVLVPRRSDKLSLQTIASSEPDRKALALASQEVLRKRKALAELGDLLPTALENQRIASDQQRQAIEAFDGSAAPRLAESLQPGIACPVCGSHEHPSPAVSAGETTVSSADRDAASKAASEATDELQRLSARRDEIAESLGGGAQQSLDAIEAHHQQVEADHAAAATAVADLATLTKEIETAEAEKAMIADRLTAIDRQIAGLEPQIAAAIINVEALQLSLGDLAVAWEADADSVLTAVDLLDAVLVGLEQRIDESRIAALAENSAMATAKASEKLLTETLGSSPFATVDEAKGVALVPSECDDLASAIEKFDVSDAKNRTLLTEVLKLALPDERPDLTDLESAADSARASAEQAASAASRVTGHLDLAITNLDEAEAIRAGVRDATDRSDALESLAKTCDGRGPKKIALETWILAGELERVAAAANYHLSKMTNGRYQIERSDNSGHGGRQAGLDLRVLDAHTGASRRPGSLSGGEQFQASLALALGLADVIGHGGNANGRVFEALFVDEGFGSLDPDSLQQAVDALSHIQAGGRTVGVITHVEAMKEQLAIGIRVDHLPTGKGSTLTVYPKN